jgi:alkylhydroperoxidase family enzyme
MAYVPYADLDDLPAPVRQRVDEFPIRLNVFRMLANSPTTVASMTQLAVALLGTLDLPPALREMAILWTGRRTGADYEWVQHLPLARAAGVTEDQIQAIGDLDPSRPCFTPAQAAALAMVDRIATGGPSSAAGLDALSAWFTVRETVELTVLAGYYLMLSRILVHLSVDIDPGGDEIAARFAAPAPAGV